MEGFGVLTCSSAQGVTPADKSMTRRLFVFLAAAGLVLALGATVSSCGPISSVVCNRAALVCPNVDLDACEATVDLLPPRTRSELSGCITNARSCGEAVDCFARFQLPLPMF
jgi:hypothetical protein